MSSISFPQRVCKQIMFILSRDYRIKTNLLHYSIKGDIERLIRKELSNYKNLIPKPELEKILKKKRDIPYENLKKKIRNYGNFMRASDEFIKKCCFDYLDENSRKAFEKFEKEFEDLILSSQPYTKSDKEGAVFIPVPIPEIDKKIQELDESEEKNE